MAAQFPFTEAHSGSPPLAVSTTESNRIYVGMGLLLITLILIAFPREIFARPTGAPPLTLLVHVHAALFTSWVVVFTTQAWLAQRGLLRYHRQLGLGFFVLAALIVIVGFYVAIEGARRGHNPGGVFPNAFGFMAVSWTDIVLFGSFVFAAWQFRKQPALHKRLTLFATLGGFLFPTITRLPFVPAPPQGMPYLIAILATVLLIPAVTSLLIRRRVHWLDLVGAIVIFVSIPLRMVIGLTETWQQFAAWTVN
jgi:hypothetical protein